MNPCPHVSIIINNFNYAFFLPHSIESALGQSYDDVEVIVVDDGSTDSSRSIIEGYSDRIISVFQANGKQGSALNRGFSISTGDLILFLDADDYLLPRAVQTIVENFHEGIAKVHFRLNVVDSQSQYLGYTIPSERFSLPSGNLVTQLLKSSSYVSAPMTGNAYTREALQKILPIPKEYNTTADDYLMISSPFCGKLQGVEQSLGCYRIHSNNQWALNSISASRFRRFVSHDLQNFSLLKQRADENHFHISEDLEMRSMGRIWSRIASLRLEPDLHPVRHDNIWKLMYFGIRALWKYSGHNLPKRLIYSVFILWVCVMPKPLVKTAYTWLYAPHLRSNFLNRTLNSIRGFVS